MRTIKVRIALQVDPEGNWDAGGSSDCKEGWDDQNGNFDLDQAKRYWIETEVPVPAMPEPETISGNAVEAA